jgi:transcriptional regulator with XRE-family HTH domain
MGTKPKLAGIANPAALTEPYAMATPAESFGTRLQRLRKAHRLTLEQIAAELNVSKPTVWAWEKGRSRPIEERIGALAGMLGVERDELISGRDDPAIEELFAQCRETIARACGTSPKKIKIFIEL